MIQHFWNQRQKILILDCNNIQISIIHAEVKFFFKFFNEKNKNDHLKVIDLNEICCKRTLQVSLT